MNESSNSEMDGGADAEAEIAKQSDGRWMMDEEQEEDGEE